MHLKGAKAQLGEDLEPLDITELSGRLEYKAADAGFTMASKGLSLNTANGVKMAPADFSLTLKDQNDAAKAGGERVRIVPNDPDIVHGEAAFNSVRRRSCHGAFLGSKVPKISGLASVWRACLPIR